MIVNFSILMCILAIILGVIIDRWILNPLSIFGIIWLIIFICSSTYPNLSTPDDEIYYFILIGIIALICGYVIASIFRPKHFTLRKIKLYRTGTDTKLNTQLTVFLLIVCIIGYFYNLFLVIRGSGSLNTAIIKAYLQTFTLQKTSWLNALYFLIIEPLSTILPVIAVSNWVFGDKNIKVLLLTIVLVVVKTIANATRNTLMMVIVYFLIGLLYFIKKTPYLPKIKKYIRKKKRQFILFSVIGIILFSFMTISRGANILENLWVDFALPPRMFEVWRGEIDTYNIVGNGFASLQGFIFPIFYILKNIFHVDMPENIAKINDLITRTDTVFVWPGQKVTANAYVSMFWFFYLDARLFGIIIGSFLLGYISCRIYKRFQKYENEACFTSYCIMLNIIIFSLVRMQLTNVSFALGILYMLLLYRKKPINKVLDQNYENTNS